VPVEPLVPKKPVQLITDESTSGTREPGALLINGTVMSNVTVMTTDEPVVLLSSAIISIVSTLAMLLVTAVILYRVSNLVTQFHIICSICLFRVCIVNL